VGAHFKNGATVRKKWRELGLEELNISFDDFHLEYLRLFGGEENVVNAARAAVEEGLRTVVAVTRTRETKIDASYVRKLMGDLAGEVIVTDDFISPTSRASGLYEEAVENLPPFVGCARAGSEISIHPNGDGVLLRPHNYRTCLGVVHESRQHN
jgi:hypothetical protein